MRSMGTPITVGTVAPSFVLHDDARRPLSSSEARGRPWVLAFVRRWKPGVDDAAIRAQLRGLGAILFIVSDAGVWSFRPDDDVELSAGSSPRLLRELADLGARWGVHAREDGVFVVDGEAIIRFAHAPGGELTSSLAGALEAAGRELLGLPPRPGITRRDWAVMSLVAGFGQTLLIGFGYLVLSQISTALVSRTWSMPTTNACTAWLARCGTCADRMLPRIATPSAPPTCRIDCTAADPTPVLAGCSVLSTASVAVGSEAPTPMPTIVNQTAAKAYP